MKVSNMTSATGHNKVANQFIIEGCVFNGQVGTMFQSYDSNIAFKPANGDSITLDRDKWDYSATTGRYRNDFLREGIADTRKKIKSGEYILADLNAEN